MNREAIYQALFDKLSAIPGIKTKSRRLRHWTDVTQGEQPALFQTEGKQSGQNMTGLPTKWTLAVDVYLYVKTPAPQVPGTVMNPLLDAIEAALAPDNPIKNTNTLGGLVEWCRIEGTIETDEGTLGDQAVAVVPILIYTT